MARMSRTARKSTAPTLPAFIEDDDDEVEVVGVNPPPAIPPPVPPVIPPPVIEVIPPLANEVIDLTSSDDDESTSEPSSEPSSESRGKKQTKWVQCFTFSHFNSFVSFLI